MAKNNIQEKNKEKVNAVYEVVGSRCSRSDIFLVLEHYENNVEHAIHAIMEDGAKEALNQWTHLGIKQPAAKKKRNRNRNKNKPVVDDVVVEADTKEIQEAQVATEVEVLDKPENIVTNKSISSPTTELQVEGTHCISDSTIPSTKKLSVEETCVSDLIGSPMSELPIDETQIISEVSITAVSKLPDDEPCTVKDLIISPLHDLPVEDMIISASHDLPVEDMIISPLHKLPVEDMIISPSHDLPVEDMIISPSHDLPVEDMHEVLVDNSSNLDDESTASRVDSPSIIDWASSTDWASTTDWASSTHDWASTTDDVSTTDWDYSSSVDMDSLSLREDVSNYSEMDRSISEVDDKLLPSFDSIDNNSQSDYTSINSDINMNLVSNNHDNTNMNDNFNSSSKHISKNNETSTNSSYSPSDVKHRSNSYNNRRKTNISKSKESIDNERAIKKNPTIKGIDRSVKDLQRQTIALQRHKVILNNEVERSFKSIAKVFDEIRDALSNRETEIMIQLDKVKEHGNQVLSDRLKEAAALKLSADRSASMNNDELADIRAEIKTFVSDRRIDEDIGKTTRFTCNYDHMLEEAKNFGEAVSVKTFYNDKKRPSSSSSISNLAPDRSTTPVKSHSHSDKVFVSSNSVKSSGMYKTDAKHLPNETKVKSSFKVVNESKILSETKIYNGTTKVSNGMPTNFHKDLSNGPLRNNSNGMVNGSPKKDFSNGPLRNNSNGMVNGSHKNDFSNGPLRNNSNGMVNGSPKKDISNEPLRNSSNGMVNGSPKKKPQQYRDRKIVNKKFTNQNLVSQNNDKVGVKDND